jgi:hypothetical protein
MTEACQGFEFTDKMALRERVRNGKVVRAIQYLLAAL